MPVTPTKILDDGHQSFHPDERKSVAISDVLEDPNVSCNWSSKCRRNNAICLPRESCQALKFLLPGSLLPVEGPGRCALSSSPSPPPPPDSGLMRRHEGMETPHTYCRDEVREAPLRNPPPLQQPCLEEERPLLGRQEDDLHQERLLAHCCCWSWDVFWGAKVEHPFCVGVWLSGALKPLLERFLERPLEDDLGLRPFLEARSLAFSLCSSFLSNSATLGKTSPSKRSLP